MDSKPQYYSIALKSSFQAQTRWRSRSIFPERSSSSKISCVEQTEKRVKPFERLSQVSKRLKIFWPNRKSTKHHPGEPLTKRQSWVFFCLIPTSPFTSEAFYKSLQLCIPVDYSSRFLSKEPHL